MDRREAYFLDTNVLMYAVGRPHGYKKPCVEVLHRIETDQIQVVTSAEVLQEILHRYRSIGKSDLASKVFRYCKVLCEEILPVLGDDLDHAESILRTYEGIAVRDAVHAAVMKRCGIERILSTDRHFDPLPQIERVDPKDFKNQE